MEKFQRSSALPMIKYNFVVLFLSQLYYLFIYASKYFLIDHHYKRYVRIYYLLTNGKIYWCSRRVLKAYSHWLAAMTTVSLPMWTPSLVCIEPIHDDSFTVATAMWTPLFDCIKPIHDDTFAIATAMWTPPLDCIQPIHDGKNTNFPLPLPLPFRMNEPWLTTKCAPFGYNLLFVNLFVQLYYIWPVSYSVLVIAHNS